MGLAVAQVKVDDVVGKVPVLKLELRETTPRVDIATKRRAEAQNVVSQLQRLNQVSKRDLVHNQGEVEVLRKELKTAEEKYAVLTARVTNMQKDTRDYDAESERLKQKIKLLSDSKSKVQSEQHT